MEERSYVDVNVFVYWLTADPRFGERALRWIERVEEDPRSYATSALTLWEVPVILAGIQGSTLRDPDLATRAVRAVVETGVTVVELRREDYLRALEFVLRGADLEDAIHLASALRAGCTRVVSNDRDFERFIRRVF